MGATNTTERATDERAMYMARQGVSFDLPCAVG